MHARQLDQSGELRTFVVVFDTGDDPVSGLEAFAREHRLSAAQVTGIGAFSRATVGYFDLQRRDYDRIPLDQQVEVLALNGNIGLKEGTPALHLHVVLGLRDGSARGGHLLEATVRPTLRPLIATSRSWVSSAARSG